ncbi:MAG: polyprenyl synthetase family protein [Deltaproteobacteria bacterium]|nr:polyprenyl synthetase family protein [Deltaproteobacteria bacterium]
MAAHPQENHGSKLPSGARAGLEGLSEVTRDPRVDDRARERLEDVTRALSVDLAWLSTALADACDLGPSPGRETAAHLVGAGGKRVRPVAVLLSAAAANGLGGDRAGRARAVALASELVHSATLLHDDVIDDSHERRGRETARVVWGNAVSVLSGDLLLTHALEVVHPLGDGRILGDMLATMRKMVEGEILQLRGRASLDLSELTYERVVQGKTASLFAWACRSGARAVHGDERVASALGAYGAHVGVAFQIVDDLLDLVGDPRRTGKSLLADVREGKPTLPLLRAIARDATILERVRLVRENGDEALAAEIAAAIVQSGAIDEVRARAMSESSRALSALDGVPRGAAREALARVAEDLAARLA